MRSGVIVQGRMWLRTNATGNRIRSLLRSDPAAILPTIGSSRLAANPITQPGVTAASSMTTPAAFTPALAAWLATSSREAAATFAIAAISSKRAISPTLIDASPSSLVLPFQSMSGDPEQEYFADGAVEDIIT